jgi:hypothetical protein
MSNNHTPHEYEDTEYSRDLTISSSGRENIKDLQDLPGSPFSEATMKDVYVLAVAYGYRHDRLASESETGSMALVQRETLSEDQVALMEAVAVAHEGTPQVLQDQSELATLAQRYALGGLEAMLERYDGADSFRDEFISEVTAAR